MPSSTWASVPTKTRPRDRAIRATVSLSEASARTACTSGPRRRIGLVSGRSPTAPAPLTAGTGAGGADAWMAVLSTVTSVEFQGAHELLEGRLLFAHEAGRPVHLDEPGE